MKLTMLDGGQIVLKPCGTLFDFLGKLLECNITKIDLLTSDHDRHFAYFKGRST